MQSKNNLLLTYWHISLAWHNRGPKTAPNFTVHEAIDTLNAIMATTQQSSKLFDQAYDLKQEIVQYGIKDEKLKVQAKALNK